MSTTAPADSAVELQIGGMTCASCAMRIEKKLKLDFGEDFRFSFDGRFHGQTLHGIGNLHRYGLHEDEDEGRFRGEGGGRRKRLRIKFNG